METKRVSEGSQQQSGATPPQANLEAATEFAQLLDSLIAAGALGTGEADPLLFASLQVAENEEPVAAEEPVVKDEMAPETKDESDKDAMHTEKAKPEQAPVVTECYAPVQAVPEKPVAATEAEGEAVAKEQASPEKPPVCQTQPQVAPECLAKQEAAPDVATEQLAPAVKPLTEPVAGPSAQSEAPKMAETKAAPVATENVPEQAAVVAAPVPEAAAKDSVAITSQKVAAAPKEELAELDTVVPDISALATDTEEAPVQNNAQNSRAAERALAPKISEGYASQAFKAQLQALEKTAFQSDGPSGHTSTLSTSATARGPQALNGLFQGSAGLKLGEDKPATAKTKESASRLSSSDQDKVVEKVKELLKNAEAAKNGNSFVIRMDPPSLGEMTVKVMHKDGQMYARIVPDNADVEAVLRNRMPELLQTLSASGINTQNVHVSIGGERSETEMFQFSKFFNQPGSNQSNGNESSKGHSDGKLSPEATAAHLAEQQLEARNSVQQPGWVA